MTRPRILVACIGNIFFGDDAFGVEVARRLSTAPLPEGVRVVDFGIRGLDLSYALLDGGYDAVILVDAAPRGGPPGTLYLLEPLIDDPGGEPVGPALQPHGLDLDQILRFVRGTDAQVGRIVLVGCEPSPLAEPEDLVDGLSQPVQRAVEEAVPLIASLAGRLLQGEAVETGWAHKPFSAKEVGTWPHWHGPGANPGCPI